MPRRSQLKFYDYRSAFLLTWITNATFKAISRIYYEVSVHAKACILLCVYNNYHTTNNDRKWKTRCDSQTSSLQRYLSVGVVLLAKMHSTTSV